MIDQSGSIGQEKFDQLRLALNQFFYAFNLTKDGDKIALLKFDDVCDIKSPKYLVSNFSYDKEDMSNKMISTDYRAGGTSTKLAIE